jgi:hypothetical protein
LNWRNAGGLAFPKTLRTALLALLSAGAIASCANQPSVPIPGAPAHHVEGGFRNVPATPAPDAVAFAFDRVRLALIPNPDARARPAPMSSAAARAAWDATFVYLPMVLKPEE